MPPNVLSTVKTKKKRVARKLAEMVVKLSPGPYTDSSPLTLTVKTLLRSDPLLSTSESD